MSARYPKLSRWHNDVISTLENIGLIVTDIRKNGHIVVKGRLNGQPFRWNTSSTPSARNAIRKMIADLKRELRKCGIEEIPQFSIGYLTDGPDPADIWKKLRAWEKSFVNQRNENGFI